jgi:hypothetical protein
MPVKNKNKKLWSLQSAGWLSLFATLCLLNSCSTKVVIPDVEWCASVGLYGAICQNSISDKSREISNKEFIRFLEAQLDDPKTSNNESKGPALCTSSEDFTKIKIAIQKLCNESQKCEFEKIKEVFNRLQKVENPSFRSR